MTERGGTDRAIRGHKAVGLQLTRELAHGQSHLPLPYLHIKSQAVRKVSTLDDCGSLVGRKVGRKSQPAKPNTMIYGCHSCLCCPITKRHTQRRPPSRIWSTRPMPSTRATTRTIVSSRPLPSWYRQTTVTEGVTEDLRVEGCVGRGWRWSTITPNRHGVRRGAATQHP